MATVSRRPTRWRADRPDTLEYGAPVRAATDGSAGGAAKSYGFHITVVHGLTPPAAEAIRRERIRAGLSQAELADRVGVSQATVSTWEIGTSSPRASRVEALNRVLDLGREGGDDFETPTASAYGEWLSRTRPRSGMTRRELAERSGVSEPQIWNIETGKTLNPRAETRNRLSEALGERPSDETIQITETDAAIPELGGLIDFDPHDPDDLPDEPGVYVFYDVSERPVYVGQSDKMKRRIGEHEQAFWFKRPIVQTGAYVRIADRTLRTQVESIMIRFLKSNAVINKQNVQRSSSGGV